MTSFIFSLPSAIFYIDTQRLSTSSKINSPCMKVTNILKKQQKALSTDPLKTTAPQSEPRRSSRIKLADKSNASALNATTLSRTKLSSTRHNIGTSSKRTIPPRTSKRTAVDAVSSRTTSEKVIGTDASRRNYVWSKISGLEDHHDKERRKAAVDARTKKPGDGCQQPIIRQTRD